MRRFLFFVVAVASMSGLVALIAPAHGHADGESTCLLYTSVEGEDAFRKWLETTGVENIQNVNRALTAATPWTAKVEAA